MTGTEPSSSGRTRRSFLAAAGTGVTLSTSGCTELFTDVPSVSDQLSVTITAVPDDDDRQVNGIFRHLEENLNAVGIDVSLDLRTPSEFAKTVLLEHDFDLYVGRYPGCPRPDSLYELLHSRFGPEPGWQNPFGLTHMGLDEHLETQRTKTGQDRQVAIADALDLLLIEKPFVPIVIPPRYHVVNANRFEGWDRQSFRTRLGFLDLDPQPDVEQFTGLLTDARATQNLNPLAANFRTTGAITSLLYDSLGTNQRGELQPWLATDWTWDGQRLTASLRPDVTFHDGEPLDASDVAFTFEFLADLSLGRAESPVPAARFRRQTSAVRSVTAVDERTVEFTVDTSTEVGSSILAVPVLPEHVWRATVEDFDEETATTETWLREALRDETISKIGSGPYQFASWVRGDRLVFERFEDHFTLDAEDLPSPPVAEMVFLSAPNGPSAVGVVDAGDASAIVTPLQADVIGEANDLEAAMRISDPNWAYYHVGFNTRNPPFSNPNFRQAVASLIDREWLASNVFHGQATPTAVPAIDSPVTAAYEWDGADPVTPFVGTDGNVNVAEARNLFREMGYRYDESDQLVVNN